ncbi:aaRS-interacting multifunctional protein 2 isoform X2 [Oratosquilla oratoria]|uniref:aaRS-interacting multifunctional protein 2 isoform X2 n=1 Tax=Oratosquilla oratoria TaxID=337810 RepID=UPI003F762C5D
MYHLDKQVQLQENISLPTCMYHIEPLNTISKLDVASSYYGQSGNTLLDHTTSDMKVPDSVLKLEARQEGILKKLKDLKQQVLLLEQKQGCPRITGGTPAVGTAASHVPVKEGVVHDMVISAHPKHAPYGLLILRQMLKNCGMPVYASNHVHSSIPEVGQNLKTQFADAPCGGRSSHQLGFTVQWKSVKSTDLMVNPIAQSKVVGEANIVRYISRLFPQNSPYNYEACGTIEGIAEVDTMFDTIQSNVIEGKNKDKAAMVKQYNARLANSKWLLGGDMSIVDVFAWSAFKQTGLDVTAPAHLSKWSKALDQLAHMKTVKYYRGHGRKMSEGGHGRKSSERKASESGGRLRKNSERKSAERKISESGGRPRKNSERKTSESGGHSRKNSESTSHNKRNSESSSKPYKKEKKSLKQAENTETVAKEVVINGTSELQKQHLSRKEFEDYLKNHNIRYQAKDHEEVFTVEAMMKYVQNMPGLHMKNLFLKDKKKKYYLFSARHDVDVKLNEIAKLIGTKELRFADEKIMFDLLGVKQGCVTAYALVNDKDHAVEFLLDEEAMNEAHSFVNFHPLSNAATLGISPSDLKKFIALTGHKAKLLKL